MPQSSPKVLNRHIDGIPKGAVYVGRGSPYGNPFKRPTDGRTRLDIIRKFSTWLREQPELMEQVKRELRGKDLVCYCAPAFCHAEILLEIANEETV